MCPTNVLRNATKNGHVINCENSTRKALIKLIRAIVESFFLCKIIRHIQNTIIAQRASPVSFGIEPICLEIKPKGIKTVIPIRDIMILCFIFLGGKISLLIFLFVCKGRKILIIKKIKNGIAKKAIPFFLSLKSRRLTTAKSAASALKSAASAAGKSAGSKSALSTVSVT